MPLTATSHAGHIDVAPEARRGTVIAHVRDTGPGVPPADRERIFDSFVRRGHHHTAGAGLGLAIARRIARGHGGELTCDECTAGACFTLTIPATPQTQPVATMAVP